MSSTIGVENISHTNGTNAITVSSGGDVGIGTSSPSSYSSTTLEVKGSSTTSAIKMTNSTTGGGDVVGFDFEMNSNDMNFVNRTSGGVQKFWTNSSERMRIDSSGNVLVGKTSSSFTTAGIELNQNGVAGKSFFARSGGDPISLNRLSSDGDILTFYKDSSLVGSIGTFGSALYIASPDGTDTGLRLGNRTVLPVTTTGALRDNQIDLGSSSARFQTLYATTSSINTSDKNEKNTITDSDLGIDFIKRLTPKSYIFNGKTRTHYGLIAQDVETVLTDINKPTSGFAGFIKSDISEEQDGSEYRYGLRYGEFVAPLIQAVKDQQAIIEDLQARITALENGQ